VPATASGNLGDVIERTEAAIKPSFASCSAALGSTRSKAATAKLVETPSCSQRSNQLTADQDSRDLREWVVDCQRRRLLRAPGGPGVLGGAIDLLRESRWCRFRR
jgi:hypothetical protein